MKRFALFVLLTLSAYGANDFKAAVNTLNIQDCEGTGFTLAYNYSPSLTFETTYIEAYLRGVKKRAEKEKWHAFQTQRLGIRYYLKSYMENQIRLYVSVGAEYIYNNDKLTDEEDMINSYGLLGVDFAIDENWNLEFAMGSNGKGVDATKLETSPNYAHGFNSAVTVGYSF